MKGVRTLIEFTFLLKLEDRIVFARARRLIFTENSKRRRSIARIYLPLFKRPFF